MIAGGASLCLLYLLSDKDLSFDLSRVQVQVAGKLQRNYDVYQHTWWLSTLITYNLGFELLVFKDSHKRIPNICFSCSQFNWCTKLFWISVARVSIFQKLRFCMRVRLCQDIFPVQMCSCMQKCTWTICAYTFTFVPNAKLICFSWG